jgi:hypothetical protein
MACCSLAVAFLMFSPTAMTAVSSAKVTVLVFAVWGTSCVYNRYRAGENYVVSSCFVSCPVIVRYFKSMMLYWKGNG